MEEKLLVEERDLDMFKSACNETCGIEFIDYNNGYANVSFTSSIHLYSLGRMFELNKQLKKYLQ